MVVEDAGPVGEVEPGILGRLVVCEPLRSGLAAREGGAKLLLVACSADTPSSYLELYRESSQTLELVVRAENQHVDSRDHLRDRLVVDVGKCLPAELVEDEVSPVAEIEELEVILEDTIEPLEEAVVGKEQLVARADAAALGDDGLVLELRKVRHLECFELLRVAASTFSTQRP